MSSDEIRREAERRVREAELAAQLRRQAEINRIAEERRIRAAIELEQQKWKQQDWG